MTLPTSGPLSFDNFRSEFGVGGSIAFSQMYRGGPYVDSQIQSGVTDTFGTWSSVRFDAGNRWNSVTRDVIWDNIPRFKISSFVFPFINSSPVGGFQYEIQSTPNGDINGDFSHAIRRRTWTQTPRITNVNTQVPTSGAIALSNLRGARNY